MDQLANNSELILARLRFVPISFEQTRGPFATFYYRLIKHVIETNQWQKFEEFFNRLDEMGTNIYVRSPGPDYEANMDEIEYVFKL